MTARDDWSKRTSSSICASRGTDSSPELLAELLRDAASIVKMEGGDVVIAHAYVERRLRPLNLFFQENEAEAIAAAGRDYGQSIKDLAASNIFPGDLLTKNFGVTRHGRVVFYDYDELCFLTDCNFRKLPEARHSGGRNRRRTVVLRA